MMEIMVITHRGGWTEQYCKVCQVVTTANGVGYIARDRLTTLVRPPSTEKNMPKR